MAMRATTVRFSDDLWSLLEQEASSAGVSAAQFVRDATVLRIAYLMGRRGEPGIEDTLTRIGALVALVGEPRQFFKSCLGLPEPWQGRRESPLSHSFCQHAVAAREPLIVDDAREHPVLKDNLAIRDLNVIAYAGIPLIDSRAQALGTLCVIDTQPRQFSKDQIRLLEDLAASVVTQIELARDAAL